MTYFTMYLARVYYVIDFSHNHLGLAYRQHFGSFLILTDSLLRYQFCHPPAFTMEPSSIANGSEVLKGSETPQNVINPVPMSFPAILRNAKLGDRFAHLREISHLEG